MQSTEKASNNKIWLSILSVGVVIAIVLNIVALAEHSDTKENSIPTINQQVNNINNTLPELEKVNTELKVYIDTLETTVEKLQKDLTDTDTALDALETEIYGKADAEKTVTLDQLKADKTELEEKSAALNKELEKAKTDNTASEKVITDQIAALEAELSKADADSKKAVEEKIEALNTELAALIKANTTSVATLQTTAADLQRQSTDIDTKIGKLKTELDGKISDSEQKVLDELNTVKTDIEAQFESINSSITTLRAKNTELEQKLTDLKTYVDSEITATEDWVSATFATFEQYSNLHTSITEINSLINTTQQSITALETKLNDKIASDIATAVASMDADIAAKVSEITDAYTEAINAAGWQTEFAYREAIKNAIDASETSMKQWVYEQMQNGFADLEAKIDELEAKIAELEENVNTIRVSDEASLRSAVASGGTIRLTADISLSDNVEIGKEVTINCGTYKITGASLKCVGGAILTINSGYIQTISAYGDDDDVAKVFLEGGGVSTINNYGAELTINSGSVYVINHDYGKIILNDGEIQKISDWGNYEDEEWPATEITINGGTLHDKHHIDAYYPMFIKGGTLYFDPSYYVNTSTHTITTTTDSDNVTIWVVTAK